MEEDSLNYSAFETIQLIKAYMQNYSYQIEYFEEGYAIFFSNRTEISHKVIIFYNIKARSFTIQSTINNILQNSIEHITETQILTKNVLKFFLRLDQIESIRKDYFLKKEQKSHKTGFHN
jgi:hypothetical protein